jgi:hypothetical protein
VYYVQIRDTRGNVIAEGESDRDSPQGAALHVARAKGVIHNRESIGTWQHFAGGTTYHVQFGRDQGHAVNLGPLYVLRIERLEDD